MRSTRQLLQRIKLSVTTEGIHHRRKVGKVGAIALSGCPEGGVSAALCPDLAQVAILYQHVSGIRQLGVLLQHRAVFRDHTVTGEHKFGCGLGETCRCIGINALAGS